MPRIQVDDIQCDANPGETVLEALRRNGLLIPCSCRQGICQTCCIRTASGRREESVRGATDGLSAGLIEKGFFLACQLRPVEDLRLTLQDSRSVFHESILLERSQLSDKIYHFALRVPTDDPAKPGQFINVRTPVGETRSYSLAGAPPVTPWLELHVERIPGGVVSRWLCDTLEVGGRVDVSSAIGDCHYYAEDCERPLLLIGTGSGLAPLYGVIRDALLAGHKGEITLYHGSSEPDGLYLRDELKSLEESIANFHYFPCLPKDVDDTGAGVLAGNAGELALARHRDLSGYRVYLCGNSAMVREARRAAYLHGADLSMIHADEFSVAAPATSKTATTIGG